MEHGYATLALNTSGDISLSNKLEETIDELTIQVASQKELEDRRTEAVSRRIQKLKKAQRCFKFSKAPKIRRKCIRG